MSGLAGGTIGRTSVREMLAEQSGNGESTWHTAHDQGCLGLAYHETDPKGSAMWTDGRRSGMVYGAITNRQELGRSHEELFERLLERPRRTAGELEGAFLVVCYDAGEDRFVVVTDKLGARPCYYTERGPFVFASAVSVLLSHIDDPTLDEQAASNLLLIGHMWGDRTLVEGVRTLRPARVMEVVDGERRIRRYWKPSYDEAAPGEPYLSELAERYRQSIERVSTTLPAEAGLWLSGGLDSRTTGAVLRDQARSSSTDFETLRGYTYDANPPTSDNPTLAAAVAQRLGIGLEQVPLTAETLASDFERLIETTDGMNRWSSTTNVSPTYHVSHLPPVVMEGIPGELVGDHLLRPHFTEYDSVVESQLASEAAASVDTVNALLDEDVDPLEALEREVDNTPESTFRRQVLDIHFQNYYHRGTLESNRPIRAETGCRAPYVDGDLLEWCSRLPLAYRKGALRSVPFTDATVPTGTSRAKLALSRRLAPTTTDITYERSKVKPSYPYQAHVAGFLANVVVNRLRNEPTYGNGQLADFWIRNENTAVHRYVTDLVDDACSRDLFSADAVREVYDAHMAGDNNASMLSQITTLEYWLQNHLD